MRQGVGWSCLELAYLGFSQRFKILNFRFSQNLFYWLNLQFHYWKKPLFSYKKHPQSKSLIFSTVTPQKKHCASSSIADAIAFFKAVPCLLSQSVIFGSPCLAALEASHIVSTSKGAFKRLNVNILEGIAYINFITRSGFCFALEISILVQFDIVSFYFDITVGSRSACLSIIYCCFGCVETRPHNIPLFSAVSFMILPFRTDFQPWFDG